MKDLDISGSRLEKMKVLFCLIESCIINESDLSESNFGLSRFRKASLNNANLTLACFAGCVMEEVQITNSLLDRVDLTLVKAQTLNVTGSKQNGIILDRAKIQGLTR